MQVVLGSREVLKSGNGKGRGVHRIPLLTQFSVLLLVGGVESQQRLQVASVRLHILVVDVDVVQILLLLKYLFCRTWGKIFKVIFNKN